MNRSTRIPSHIGIIPDGNRRWAEARGLPKHAGYEFGLAPAVDVVKACLDLGVTELTFYGFTQDNNKRPRLQRLAFQQACVRAAELLADLNVSLLVVGNVSSPMFPAALRRFAQFPLTPDRMQVNLLVNYSWQWDLEQALRNAGSALPSKSDMRSGFGSAGVSKMDLIIRRGGRSRLSGFLPFQSVYADLRIIDALWPDYDRGQLAEALSWYEYQDVTLGG